MQNRLRMVGATIVWGVAALPAPALAQNLAISIGIRETNPPTSIPIGGNGGATGGIEFVNLDGFSLPVDGAFHTVSFNIAASTLTPFAGTTANGTLDGTRGVLEHVRIRNIDGITQPLQIFIDNIVNTNAAGAPTVVQDFESFAPGVEVTFQEPRFSGSTSAFLALLPNSSLTSNLAASQGTISDEMNLQFVDATSTNWVRLTTFNTPNQPNPVIEFASGDTLRFDIKAVVVPEPAAVLALGLAGLALRQRRR